MDGIGAWRMDRKMIFNLQPLEKLEKLQLSVKENYEIMQIEKDIS